MIEEAVEITIETGITPKINESNSELSDRLCHKESCYGGHRNPNCDGLNSDNRNNRNTNNANIDSSNDENNNNNNSSKKIEHSSMHVSWTQEFSHVNNNSLTPYKTTSKEIACQL